ncbi:MAG: hypothetical protein NTW71_03170 [Deltaproteobacteria bacterium]|nr:hypothetical protein [Deltaproteobacteria bacterium]
MRKLNKRQILIFVVMLLAVLYGAYEFFSIGRKSQAVADTAKKAADLNTFIGDITLALTKDTPLPVDAYMIKRAEAEWLRDPFYEPIDKREEAIEKAAAHAQQVEAAETALKGQLKYTGYVDMGHKKIAIVNGNEYVTGDALDVGGYVLNGIYPTKIVIYNKMTRLTIDIALQE